MKTRIVEIWIDGQLAQKFERSEGNEIHEVVVRTHDRTVKIDN